MPSDFARRGRPRGSGLDDRGLLRRINDLLEADPTLKPTTAIKAIGVTDPSTIRRLRDKLKIPEFPNIAPSSADLGSGGMPSSVLVEARSAVPPSVSRPSGSPVGAAGMASDCHSEASPSWFAQWCALGLSAMSTTVDAQMALFDELLSVPQVESALRHQLKCNEVVKAFCPKSSDFRNTLH